MPFIVVTLIVLVLISAIFPTPKKTSTKKTAKKSVDNQAPPVAINCIQSPTITLPFFAFDKKAESFSEPGDYYQVSCKEWSCTCPCFASAFLIFFLRRG